jgi:DNA repair exonuclease SbcCD ATPase subunit
MDVTVTKEEVEAAASTGECKEMLPLPASGPALEMYADAHKHFYSARTDVNRRLKEKRVAAAEVLKKLPDGYKPVEGIEGRATANRQLMSGVRDTISGLEADKRASAKAAETRERLTKQVTQDEESAKNYRALAAAIKTTQAHLDAAQAEVTDLEEKLTAARDRLEILSDSLIDRDTKIAKAEEAEERADGARATLAALPGAFDESLLDAEARTLDELMTESDAIEAERSRQRTWNEHVILREEAEIAEDESGRLSALCEWFGNDLPAQAVREAKLPIPGLALSGEKITVDGKPLDDLSTSEQMEVTMAIAKSLAGELKVICIDGAERLDEKTRAEFIRQADGDEFYYFVTRVGTPQAGEIEIKEGRVA